MTAPLEDPTYVPKHPPENGYIPWVVEKWGLRSQLRWFRRFYSQLRSTGRTSFWDPYRQVPADVAGNERSEPTGCQICGKTLLCDWIEGNGVCDTVLALAEGYGVTTEEQGSRP